MVNIAEDQPEYLTLPAYQDDEQGGRTIHKWKLTLWERIKILFTGRLWFSVLNFHRRLQPIKPTVHDPFKN